MRCIKREATQSADVHAPGVDKRIKQTQKLTGWHWENRTTYCTLLNCPTQQTYDKMRLYRLYAIGQRNVKKLVKIETMLSTAKYNPKAPNLVRFLASL